MMTRPAWYTHPVSAGCKPASAGNRNNSFNPRRPRGLLEPCAATSGTHGSEGAGARQRVPATRLYVLPPIRFPDGRTYLKIGANTMIDHWLPDPAAVRAWYDRGNDDGPLPALREALTGLLPGVRVRAWHTRRCADAYTAHRRPYID